MYIDTHAHFDLCIKDDSKTEDSFINNLKENNVNYAVQISTDTSSFQWSFDFSSRYRNNGIFFTIGIHPSSIANEDSLNEMSNFMNQILNSPDKSLLFGIGETGLDFYRMRQPKELQIKSFYYQLEMAQRFGLPVIVHSRDARDETLKILREFAPVTGIMHCFSGDSKDAGKFLDLGFHISFAGNVTYKNATDLQDAASFVPLDRLLVETDAPFLSPVPLRGKKNMPGNIVHTYRFISELRKQGIEIIEDRVAENFFSILKKAENNSH